MKFLLNVNILLGMKRTFQYNFFLHSRHSHVAAVYDDVSEVWASRLVGQVQFVGSPQRLMETSQASHRWGRWVICGRRPCCCPVEPRVADCLVGRG